VELSTALIHLRNDRILGITRNPEGMLELRFAGAPNLIHTVQASADLQTWENIGTETTDGQGRFTFVENLPALSHQFYRVKRGIGLVEPAAAPRN
jgi:hypothetical protein